MENADLLKRLAEARGIAFCETVLPRARRFTAPSGQALHYLAWGGSGPLLLLLHGGSLSARTWDLLALALSHRFRIVAPDLRGHGDSGWAESYLVGDHAADVLALIEELGAERVHLAGMSLGGFVAGYAAVALGARAASLTFIDVGSEVNFAASARMRGFMETIPTVERVEQLVAQALAASPRTDPDLMLYRYQALTRATAQGVVLRQDRGRSAAYFQQVLGEAAKLAELAAQVACPTLVVRGGRSQVLSDETAARFANRFPHGRWAVVPEAGHNVQEDQPKALASLLEEHLDQAQRV